MNPKQGIVLWLTGLPCSGKSTIAGELEQYFQLVGKPVQKLDGDLLRATISSDLGFAAADRYRQSERVAFIANMLSMHGINVVVALVSPSQEMRNRAREICSAMREVYIRCSVDECKRRDVKGMYTKAIRGEIKNFTGINDAYEPPINPDLIIDTEKDTIQEGVSKLIEFVKNQLPQS